jgi:hypothetical protein
MAFWQILLLSSMIVLQLCSTTTQAQNPLRALGSQVDSSYITTFPEAITLKVFLNNKFVYLDIEDASGDYSLNYEPNGNQTIGVGINYKWIGFSIDYKILNHESNQRYGHTNYLDLQTTMILRKGVFDLYLQKYQGFYLENSAAMIQGWDDPETYQLRPDIRLFSTGINYTHVFNPQRFSYIASFSQTEVQRRSAGSIILGTTVSYQRAQGDSAFVPDNLIYADAFGPRKYDDLKGFTTSARFGYAHTLVALHHFFISASLDLGLSYNFTRIYTADGSDSRGNLSANASSTIKLATGYNGEKWFAGLTVASFNQVNRPSGDENQLLIQHGYARFTMAYRIMLKKPLPLPALP